MSREQALHLAAQGYRVFPVRPDKTPLVRDWPKRATTDPRRIERMWADAPGAGGVGIATGDGLVVIDLDVKNGEDGVKTLADWADERTLPWSPTTDTPSGGQHVYLRADGEYGNRVGVLPGVDVRGDGGYVVAYSDAVPPLTELPLMSEPLARLIGSRPANDDQQDAEGRTVGPAGIAAAVDAEVFHLCMAPEGMRNHTLNRAAYNLGQLVGDHLDEDTVRERLMEAAHECGIGDDPDTPETLESGLTAGMANPRTIAEAESVEPGAWTPADLATLMADGLEPPEPTLLARTDGLCLLYPGLTHSVSGESGSGKSWLAQWATAEVLHAGQSALYLDYESSAREVAQRLLTLGCSHDEITAGLTYVNPDAAPTGEEFEALLAVDYSLAVVDGVTEALGLSGIAGDNLTNSNDAVTRWHKMLPKRIAVETGAAVLQVDHVTKAKDNRGAYAIGGQAKRASITGASYIVQTVESFGRGRDGSFDLFVSKDRPGAVLAGDGDDTTSGRRVVHVEVHSTEGVVRLQLQPVRHGGDTRLHDMKCKVAAFLSEHPGATLTLIRKEVPGTNALKDQALKGLVGGEYVERTRQGQAVLHRLRRPYTEFEGLL